MSLISVTDLNALVRSGETVELIDVRTPAEFQEIHAAPAVNVPLDTFDPAPIVQRRKTPDQPLYFICRSGGRSQRACDFMAAAGFPAAVNVEGGTQAWVEAGLPVVGDPTVANPGQLKSTACAWTPKKV